MAHAAVAAARTLVSLSSLVSRRPAIMASFSATTSAGTRSLPERSIWARTCNVSDKVTPRQSRLWQLKWRAEKAAASRERCSCKGDCNGAEQPRTATASLIQLQRRIDCTALVAFVAHLGGCCRVGAGRWAAAGRLLQGLQQLRRAGEDENKKVGALRWAGLDCAVTKQHR